jgi:hypothetical protein
LRLAGAAAVAAHAVAQRVGSWAQIISDLLRSWKKVNTSRGNVSKNQHFDRTNASAWCKLVQSYFCF